MTEDKIQYAARLIKSSKRVVAMTGAGISVESGIPPFRGPGGLWETHNPEQLDIGYFMSNPGNSWQSIIDLFYSTISQSSPNQAHHALATMEQQGDLQSIITQNIDDLHHRAGSKKVIEYHGSIRQVICIDCHQKIDFSPELCESLPPLCSHCGGILKPDFIFFGESIPIQAADMASRETVLADLWLVIGTSGEVFPAAYLPLEAKNNGATIIEINVNPSNYTNRITDLFLEGEAGAITHALLENLDEISEA